MRKVLIIGLDGMSPELLFDSWVKELPNLKKICDNGVIGNLKSAFPPLTATAIASFATGKNPGKHGIFDFIYIGKSMDDVKIVTSLDIKAKTYYEILNENGKKSILVNMPLSHPPKTDDIMLTNFLAKSNKNIFPESLIDEIPELKEYRPLNNLELEAEGDFDKFLADICDVEEKRFICAKKLFYKPWDTFFVFFESTDLLHHYKYGEMLKRKDKSILNFYKKIDSYIGWFMKNMDRDTTLIIMSDHGFKVVDGMILVNNILRKKGFIKLSKDGRHTYYRNPFTEAYSEATKDLPKIHIDYLYDKFTKVPILLNMARKFARVFNKLPFKLELKNKVDKAESIAFLPAFNGYIYINKKERFDNGKVGLNEYDNVVNDIKGYLESLKDDEQRPLFKKIYKREEMYNGPLVGYAPDLLLISDYYHFDTFPYGALNIKKIKENAHADIGIFMAYGNDIANRKHLGELDIMDIAPTILHITDCPIPHDVDGRVLKEIFKPGSGLYKANPTYSHKESEQERIKKAIASIEV